MKRMLQAVSRVNNGQQVDDTWLDVRGAMAMLGATERSVRGRVARHMLPFRKFHRRILFRRSELEQFIDMLPGCSLQEARKNSASHG
jgi:hypothetical protein